MVSIIESGKDIIDTGVGFITTNPLTAVIATGATVATAGLVTGGILGANIRKKTTKRRKRKSTKRTTRKRSRRSSRRTRQRYTPHTARKGRDRSTRRIRYTKRGQPYVILRSGKARFIKASSAKHSHKRKGGRY